MIRLFNVYFPRRTFFLAIAEAAVICLALVTAVFLCLGTNAGLAFRSQHASWKIALVGMICLSCIYYSDVYDTAIVTNPREFPSRLIRGLGMASLFLAALYYAFPVCEVCRGFVVFGICLIGFSIIAFRQAFFALNSSERLAEPALLLGEGRLAESVAKEIQTRPELGLRLVGYLGKQWDSESESEITPRLGGLEDLSSVVKRAQIQRIIVVMRDRRSKLPVHELLSLRMQGVQVDYGTGLLEKFSGQIEVGDLDPSWLVFGEGFPLRPAYWSLRGIVSKLLALSLSILTLPLIPIVAILIKLSSPGPVLYRQKRVGLRDQVFYCYKFRTMRADAEADCGPTWASDNDPRITPIGRILRVTRLDEIPQLWNVLMGDMAFVGPRPERPEFIAQLSNEIPYYHLRHVVRPGITGWAQVRYKYGNSIDDAREKLKYDLFYIKNMSVSLDIWIVFQTVKTVLFGKGAL
jgi:sugar transferase (PEP-CTERM system associated)